MRWAPQVPVVRVQHCYIQPFSGEAQRQTIHSIFIDAAQTFPRLRMSLSKAIHIDGVLMKVLPSNTLPSIKKDVCVVVTTEILPFKGKNSSCATNGIMRSTGEDHRFLLPRPWRIDIGSSYAASPQGDRPPIHPPNSIPFERKPLRPAG